MNLAARQFFNSGDCGFQRNHIKYLLRLFLLTCLGLFTVIQSSGQDLDDLLETANEYYEKEQFHSAAQYYQVALGIQHDVPETIYRLAQSYRAIFDYYLAAQYYQEVLELDEASYPLAAFYQSQMQKSLGNFKNARDGFEGFIDKHNRRSPLSRKERDSFINQAKLEIEGCLWAIEQLGKSWTEIGFAAMPEPVNSTSNDYAAISSKDDQMITFTSGKKGAKGGLLDNRFGEYFTDNIRYQINNGQWSEENLSDHFDRTNTKFSDGVGTYNTTGEKYYFTSCYEGNAFCKLYVTYRENGVWKNPELLNDNVNAPGFDNKHPTLTSGGDTLIFVSNRSGGQGGNDLWFCVSQEGENWGKAKPLPGKINTPFNEASPFYYKDNLLFFSSDGHSGMGGMDIFMVTNYLENNSNIQNLGTPFNSGFDDSFFSLGKRKGYLSSNRPNGKGKFDIYSFNLPGEKDDLAEYLEESADGTQLRSRIRERDGSNLFSARDEDQFYYDNLSPEERARLERILEMRQQSDGDFDPSDLPRDDYKYYKKLDIATKATIERLALKHMLELEGQTFEKQMTVQEKLDWEFYQNVDETERLIIDRIIDLRVEARRRALGKLSPEEILYSSNPSNQERIEDKIQLRALNSLATSLGEQQKQGIIKLSENRSGVDKVTGTGSLTSSEADKAWSRLEAYSGTIEKMDWSSQLLYQQLSPKKRNDLHHSAVREFIMTNSTLNQNERQQLLSAYELESDPLGDLGAEMTEEEIRIVTEIRDALTYNLKSNSSSMNIPVKERVSRELVAQQLMLQQQLEQLSKREADTRDLQGQIKQLIAEQSVAPDPKLEQKIVDEYYSQSQSMLPLLASKETHYFNTLDPGRQLRIARLAKLVEVQIKENQNLVTQRKQFVVAQSASDQWYYQGLSIAEQQIVDELVARGWDPIEPYNRQQLAFIEELSDMDRDRVDRMMGNQPRINFEIPEEKIIAVAQQPTPNQQPSTSSQQPSTSSQQPATSSQQPAISNQQPATSSQQPAISSQQPATSSQQPATSSQQAILNDGNLYLGDKIYFDLDQYALRGEAKKAMDELIQFLNEKGQPVKVVIEGHADDLGSIAHNDLLSKNRSLSAAQYFEPASELIKVITRNYGEGSPVTSNRTAMGRQLNRRVELKIEGIRYQSLLRTFLVKPNVTLDMILDATGLLKEDVLKWNGPLTQKLKWYQPLRLPVDLDCNSVSRLLSCPSEASNNIHLVKSGENLYRLALKYSITVKALEQLNNITATDLQVGQQIRVR